MLTAAVEREGTSLCHAHEELRGLASHEPQALTPHGRMSTTFRCLLDPFGLFLISFYISFE